MGTSQDLSANMKVVVILIICFGLAIANQGKHFNENLDEFEQEFGEKVAGESNEQRAARAKHLKEVEEQVNAQNDKAANGESTWTEKLYNFSDKTMEEFKRTHEGLIKEGTSKRNIAASRSYMPFAKGYIKPADRFSPTERRKQAESVARLEARAAAKNRDAPTSYNSNIDSLSYITSVKNQGSCGSCAAFAATAMHETHLIKAGASSTNMDLSEQYLVDCAYSEASAFGCDGASLQVYTNWLAQNGGLTPLETSYPYLDTAPKLNCDTASTVDKYDSGYKISAVEYTYSCTEDTLKTAVAENGAVVTGIAASETSLQSYSNGVFSGCSSTTQDHAVLVVGYGTEDGEDYWLVKNSWGSSWGENGYIRIKRGVNMCGIGAECVWAQTLGSDEEVPPAPTCDVSGVWGSGLTGNYYLTYWNGEYIYSSVTCKDSICSPAGDESDACEYICGKAGATAC